MTMLNRKIIRANGGRPNYIHLGLISDEYHSLIHSLSKAYARYKWADSPSGIFVSQNGPEGITIINGNGVMVHSSFLYSEGFTELRDGISRCLSTIAAGKDEVLKANLEKLMSETAA